MYKIEGGVLRRAAANQPAPQNLEPKAHSVAVEKCEFPDVTPKETPTDVPANRKNATIYLHTPPAKSYAVGENVMYEKKPFGWMFRVTKGVGPSKYNATLES